MLKVSQPTSNSAYCWSARLKFCTTWVQNCDITRWASYHCGPAGRTAQAPRLPGPSLATRQAVRLHAFQKGPCSVRCKQSIRHKQPEQQDRTQPHLKPTASRLNTEHIRLQSCFGTTVHSFRLSSVRVEPGGGKCTQRNGQTDGSFFLIPTSILSLSLSLSPVFIIMNESSILWI